jgi:hypothetical protein
MSRLTPLQQAMVFWVCALLFYCGAQLVSTGAVRFIDFAVAVVSASRCVSCVGTAT